MDLRDTRAGTRPVWLVVALGLSAVLLGLLTVVLLAGPGDEVLTGTRVEGVDVGGLTRGQLVERVDVLAAARLAEPVVVTGDRDAVEATRGDAGVTVRRAATVEQAWSRGRQGIGAAWERLAALAGAREDIALDTHVDETTRTRFAADAAAALSAPPRDADVSFDPDTLEVEVVEAATGAGVDADALDERLAGALEQPGGVRIDAPSEPEEPAITDRDVAAIEDAARAVVSAPVELAHPTDGPDVALEPSDLARLVTVERDEDAAEGERLGLAVDPEDIAEHLAPLRDDLEREPVEAEIALVDGAPAISGGHAGYELDPEAIAEQVRDLATREADRAATLAGPTPEPELSRDDAEALEITEEVSSFTTEYPCCPPRVTNIQLMAEHTDGALVLPGERFSLNDHVGERTAERGFVAGGAIIDGEFEEVVGGGSSQFATTFFNAAFFAGVELVEFQPHSYYISRYPEGRESTISYNLIDVVFENNSPYGILIEAFATETAVTVRFWSSAWAQVEAFDSGRYNVVPGEERDGFDIDFGRVVTYPDGSTTREEWFHRYQPENGPDE